MLELVRPETRVQRSGPRRYTWGPVDVILAILMLPFGLAMFLIETMVWAITTAFNE